MNHLRIWLLVATLTLSGVKQSLAQLKMEQMDRYTFALSGLTIPKQLKDLKLANINQNSDGSDVMLSFENPKIGLKLSLCVYKSPAGTMGPIRMLDANGKEILEDREEEKKLHNAVLKLTDPSESYLQEYAKTLKAIASMGYPKLTSEFRFMAVPERKDSPIAYGAELSGTRELKDGTAIPWTWKTYLYSVPGYFVKIHCTYPSQLWTEVPDVEFIHAINWDKVAPSKSRD